MASLAASTGSSPTAGPPLRVVPITAVPPGASFVPRATRGLPPVLVDNAPFSVIHHLAVLSADGTPLYDLPAVAEPRGAVGLPIDRRGRVGLLRTYRPLPATVPAAFVFPSPVAGGHGFESIEAPRGFPEPGEDGAAAAMREVAEEVGLPAAAVGGVCPLGWVNINTSVYLSDVPVFAVRVAAAGQGGGAGGAGGGDDPAGEPAAPPLPADPNEHIAGVDWYELPALTALMASGGLRCGLTLATLAYALAWGPHRLAAFGTAAGGLHPLDELLLSSGGGTRPLSAPRGWLERLLVEAWERGVAAWPSLTATALVAWPRGGADGGGGGEPASGATPAAALTAALAATADAHPDGGWVLRSPLCYDHHSVERVWLGGGGAAAHPLHPVEPAAAAAGGPPAAAAATATATAAAAAAAAAPPAADAANGADGAAVVVGVLLCTSEGGGSDGRRLGCGWTAEAGGDGLPARLSLRLPSGVLSVTTG